MAALKGSTLFATRWGRAGLALALAWLIALTPAGRWFDVQLSDLRENLWPPPTELSPVTVLAIDEPTLDALGPWPWPRKEWETVLQRLHQHYTPMAVALDLVFPPGGSAAADASLGRQLAAYPVVLGQLVLPNGSVKGAWQGQPVSAPVVRGAVPDHLYRATGTLANSPAIAQSAPNGHINALLDSDGVLRRYLPMVCWKGECSVSLGLATIARAFAGGGTWQVKQSEGEAPRLSLPGLEHMSVPLVAGGGIHMPWHRYRSIPVVSLRDAVDGRVDRQLIDQRLLMVGSTAPGLADHVVTPVLSQMPGIMAHALMVDAIVELRVPHQPAWAGAAGLLLYLVGAAAIVATSWRYWQLAAIGLVCLAGVGAVLLPAYHLHGWIIPAAVPVLGLASLLLSEVALRLAQSNQNLVRRMTAYLPVPLVRRLHVGVEPAARVAWSTVMYADTVAYTVAAQRLAPDQLATWVNTGLDIVIRMVERHGGVVDNIAGDGLMAYWNEGSPEEQADHAVSAAMTICRAIRFASADLQARGLPPLDMGIGLHAGQLLSGSFGARRRRYTIHGEAANLAQRIEQTTRQSPYRLLMSRTLASIQTRYHPVSTEFTLTVGNASVPLYTIARKAPRRPE